MVADLTGFKTKYFPLTSSSENLSGLAAPELNSPGFLMARETKASFQNQRLKSARIRQIRVIRVLSCRCFLSTPAHEAAALAARVMWSFAKQFTREKHIHEEASSYIFQR